MTPTGKAIYDVEIAQNYIPLMRKMIYAYRTTRDLKEAENLIPQPDRLFTMFLKNKDQLSQTSPRFLNILYEFGSVLPRKWRTAAGQLEDCIIDHIHTMPLPAIKSFLYHMSVQGFHFRENLDKIFKVLIQRDLFKDPKLNLNVMQYIADMAYIPAEFQLASFKGFEEVFEKHEKEGKLRLELEQKIEDPENQERQFFVSHSTLDAVSRMSINYLLANSKKITQEEIKSFLQRNPIEEVNGKLVIKKNSLQSVDDYVLFNLFRSYLIFSREVSRTSLQTLHDTYYLQYVQPAIFESHECFKKTQEKIQKNVETR